MTEPNPTFSQKVADVLHAADMNPVAPDDASFADKLGVLRAHTAHLAGVRADQVVFELHLDTAQVLLHRSLNEREVFARYSLCGASDDPLQSIAKALFHKAVADVEPQRQMRDAARDALAAAQAGLDRAEARVRELRALAGYAAPLPMPDGAPPAAPPADALP